MDNLYHCCVQKTGSQWIKDVFADEIIFNKTGMKIYTYQKHLPTKGDLRKLNKRIFNRPFPENCIASPLYMDYNSYKSILKPEHYKTFFIIRDPRDIVISWYFSIKYSHPLMGKIPQHRKILNESTLEDGLGYCIEYLAGYGLFEALKSWVDAAKTDAHVMLVRFEDIIDINKQLSIFMELFSHCCILFTEKEIGGLLDKYRFDSLKKKSKKMEMSHYRRGSCGEWKDYFDEDLRALFSRLSKGIIPQLGYKD